MSYSKPLAAALTLLFTTSTAFPSAEAAGRSTTAVVNTILNGKGAPKNSLGVDGDFYIDTRSLLIYGPKVKGKWPTPQNIQGPTGATGNDGKNGSDAKSVAATTVSNVAGPQGLPGPQGEKGEKGEAGAPGLSGAPGLPGAIGPAGSSGSSGAQGPSGPAGANGSTGAQGATGPAGPSEVTVVNIPNIVLGTSVAYSYAVSENVGLLEANKSYVFEIFIRGASNLIDLVLGLDLISSGNEVSFNYVRSDFRYSTYSNVLTSYGFHLSGSIKVAANNSSLSIRIIDGRGETGSTALTLSGKAYITLVGAIR